MKTKIGVLDAFVYTTSVVSLAVSLMNVEGYPTGYETTMVFPLLYLVVYTVVLRGLRHSQSFFTVYGVIGIEWIRFVMLPPVCALAGASAGFPYINPTIDSLNLSTLLMIYELLVVSIVLRLSVNSRVKTTEQLRLSGNRFVYLVFLILALCTLSIVSRSHRLLYFLFIPLGSGLRIGDLQDTYLVLARQIVLVGLFLLFLWAVSWCKQRYERSSRRTYVSLAVILALVNVALIVGERRSAQVYTAVVCMWILAKTFPRHRRAVVYSIGTMALIVLALMSVYKFFLAFQYESYLSAISSASVDTGWLSRTLQSYFFGPENVAAAVDFAEASDIGFQNLLFDVLRSTFGVSFLMKGQGVLTSELFNAYIYGTPAATGHLVSSVGYGYLYFGPLLSPVIAAMNVFISSRVERRLCASRTYETSYLWGYVLIRFAASLFYSTPPLISYATITLGTAGLLFLVASALTVRHVQGRRGPFQRSTTEGGV